jgi:hypothetical protein
MKITVSSWIAAATLGAASPAIAQIAAEPSRVGVPTASIAATPAPDATAPAAIQPVGAAPVLTPPMGPSFKRLFSDTAIDFRRLASRDSARWLAIGTAAALVARSEDTKVGGMLARPQFRRPFESGQLIGSSPFQMGGALTAYTIGRLTGSERTMQVSADLFRAQTVAQLTTYAMKYSIRRTRPDGTRFSFPSGHTSVTFASATVMQRHFGWKAGIPAYGLAAFVAGSRLQTRRHHLSDVAFGAALGIMAGRTVTVGRGRSRLTVAPSATTAGAGVTVVGRW